MTTLRMAVLALLAIGASTGVSDRAAASSALSDTTSATAAQYSQGAVATPSDGQSSQGAVAPSDGQSSRSRPPSTNPTPAQPAVYGSDLPLTGYAAVTLLLLAVAFLIGGLLLRRGTRSG